MKWIILTCGIGLCTFTSPSIAGARPSPWECVQNILALRQPLRLPIQTVLQEFQQEMAARAAFVGVLTDPDSAYLIPYVKTAAEVAELLKRYGIEGYKGYAIAPEIEWEVPGAKPIFYADGDPRNAELFRENVALTHELEAIRYYGFGEPIPYRLFRNLRPEQKTGHELRAQLASDFYCTGAWAPDREILLAIQDDYLHWHFVHDVLIDGQSVTQATLNQGADRSLADFLKGTARQTGLVTGETRKIFGGSEIYLRVTAPTKEAFLKVLEDQDVSSADMAENFSEE